MHGYTWNEAKDSYHLVTGEKKNFGDRRIKYNVGFHRKSQLAEFLSSGRPSPDFIYEYMNEAKCRGIRLFYVKADSVYIFEEPKKNKLQSVLKEARKMDNYEKETYQRLISKRN
jgi:hypothetical protein